jgi:hypothetical protein
MTVPTIRVHVDGDVVAVDLATCRRYGDGTVEWGAYVEGNRIGAVRGRSGAWVSTGLRLSLAGGTGRTRKEALVPLVRAWLNPTAWYPVECEHGYDRCPMCDAPSAANPGEGRSDG